jgi:hypothetical protein
LDLGFGWTNKTVRRNSFCANQTLNERNGWHYWRSTSLYRNGCNRTSLWSITIIDVAKKKIPGGEVVVVCAWAAPPESVNPRKFPCLVLTTRPGPVDAEGIEAALTKKQSSVIQAKMKSSNSFVLPLLWILTGFIVASCITYDHKHVTSMDQQLSTSVI